MTTQYAKKAAIYSAIIFPGAGLWWLKSYARACIFIVPASVALIYIAKKLYVAVAPVYSNMQRQAEEGILNPFDLLGNYGKLSAELHQSIAAQQDQLGFVEAILVACWLCSIVSSYFVGKKLDLKAEAINTNA
jgi:hypothetical protein